MSHRKIRMKPEQKNKHGDIFRCRYCGRLCKGAAAELKDNHSKECSCAECLARLGVGGVNHE